MPRKRTFLLNAKAKGPYRARGTGFSAPSAARYGNYWKHISGHAIPSRVRASKKRANFRKYR